jgi:F0F1-type ATP synthase membrane subunit b/b'
VTGPAGDLAVLLDAETRFATRLETARREAAALVESARVEAERLARVADEMAESERAEVRSRIEAETAARLQAILSAHAVEMQRYASIDLARRQALAGFVVERLIDDVTGGAASEAE